MQFLPQSILEMSAEDINRAVHYEIMGLGGESFPSYSAQDSLVLTIVLPRVLQLDFGVRIDGHKAFDWRVHFEKDSDFFQLTTYFHNSQSLLTRCVELRWRIIG